MLQAEQMHKITSIALKMVEVVILSENSCHFVSCSACNNSYFLILLSSYCHLLNGPTLKVQHRKWGTPARTLSISGLKSRVLKLPFFNLKMMMKNGLDFFLKSTEPLQRYLLTCLANSASLGRFFALGSSNSEGACWIS